MICIRHLRNVLVTKCTGHALDTHVTAEMSSQLNSLFGQQKNKQQTARREAFGIILILSTILQIHKLKCS